MTRTTPNASGKNLAISAATDGGVESDVIISTP
jgi:hypothetical protein